MSLELALERNTAAIERLISMLQNVQLPTPEAANDEQQPVVQNNITEEQCKVAAAKAVERLGNTAEAKEQVKSIINKHASRIAELNQLQRNAVFSELESL